MFDHFGGFVCGFPFALVHVLLFAFWVWMLVDCILHEPPGTEKIVWILVIVLTAYVGAFIYYFVKRMKRLPR